jgi:hypothetical protein
MSVQLLLSSLARLVIVISLASSTALSLASSTATPPTAPPPRLTASTSGQHVSGSRAWRRNTYRGVEVDRGRSRQLAHPWKVAKKPREGLNARPFNDIGSWALK